MAKKETRKVFYLILTLVTLASCNKDNQLNTVDGGGYSKDAPKIVNTVYAREIYSNLEPDLEFLKGHATKIKDALALEQPTHELNNQINITSYIEEIMIQSMHDVVRLNLHELDPKGQELQILLTYFEMFQLERLTPWELGALWEEYNPEEIGRGLNTEYDTRIVMSMDKDNNYIYLVRLGDLLEGEPLKVADKVINVLGDIKLPLRVEHPDSFNFELAGYNFFDNGLFKATFTTIHPPEVYAEDEVLLWDAWMLRVEELEKQNLPNHEILLEELYLERPPVPLNSEPYLQTVTLEVYIFIDKDGNIISTDHKYF
jgi:hypothetical protein